MKKFRILILICCIMICSLSIPLGRNVIFAAQILTPYVLTNGSEKDYSNAADKNNYIITSDGTELYRMDIPKDGALEWDLWTQQPKQVNISLHRKADGSDIPIYANFTCTADNGNRAILRRYIPKGTYYLQFPKGQNTYHLSLLLYSSTGGSISNGSVVAAYCDAGIYRPDSSITSVDNIYSYKASKTGYLTITKKNLVNESASMSLSFYDGKGRKITDISSDHDISGKIVFPVKKGKSYKIKVGILKDGQQFYQMKFDFTSISEKSGSTKKKAAEIKLKKTTKGMIYAEESVKTQDWYKLNLTKGKKLELTVRGGVISGSMNLVLYDSKMKKIGSYTLMPMNDETYTYTIQNKKKLSKGTYYIKVVKERKQAAGYYEFNLH